MSSIVCKFLIGIAACIQPNNNDLTQSSVYLSYGAGSAVPVVGDFIGLSVDRLAQSLPNAKTYYWGEFVINAGDDIIKRHKEGTLTRPLIIGGHSMGAQAVGFLAERLKANSIDVDYAIYLDLPWPSPLPENVAFADNFYQMQQAPFFLLKDRNFKGELKNYNMFGRTLHIPLPSNKIVIENVTFRVGELVRHYHNDS